MTFGPGPGEAYGFAVPTGHGGAASPYVFTSQIFADVPQEWTLASITRITVHDLDSTSAQGLTLALHNGSDVAVFVQGSESAANLNGDYSFVIDPSLPTLRQASAGLGANDLIAPGTYNMEGGILIFGDAGNMDDWTHFYGTPVRPGWEMILLNQSTAHAGSVGGWTIDVQVNTVPEPATLAGITFGTLLLSRLRRRTR